MTQYSSDGSVIAPANALAYVNTTIPAGNTIANTAAETAFSSTFDIPANALVVGAVVKVKMWGVYSTDAVLAPTIRGKIKLDAVIVADSTAVTALVGATNRGWFAECSMVVASLGATGTVDSQAFLEFATAATTSLTVNAPNAAVITVDTTQALTVSGTVQWGTASATNTIQLRQLQVSIESAASSPLNSTINVTPDSHPSSPNAADDEFEVGSTLDTAGTRRAGAAAWVWANQGAASAALTSGHLVITAPGAAGVANIRRVEQAISGAFKYRAKLRLNAPDASYNLGGIHVANSSNNRTITWGMFRDTVTSQLIDGVRFAGSTYASNIASAPVTWTSNTVLRSHKYLYLEIESDGTTLTLRWSVDGVVMNTVTTETISGYLTASGGSLDRVGVYVDAETATTAYLIVDWFRRIS